MSHQASKHAKAPSPVTVLAAIVGVLIAVAAAVVLVIFTLHAAKEKPTGPADVSASAPVSEPVSDIASEPVSVPISEPIVTTKPSTSATVAQTTTRPKPTLTLANPAKSKTTVTGSVLAVMGTADPAFPLTINGKAIELTAQGSFAADITLQPGENVLQFINGEHKATRTVIYKVKVLQSVSPTGALTLEGGSSVQFRAVARKGSSVTLKFNGQKKTMSAVNTQAEEETAVSADYQTYQVTLTMPAAKTGQKQALGAATVTATYNKLTETAKTGAITIKADDTADYLVITRDYAETFSGTKVNDLSRPTNAYLPAGTVDKIVKTGSIGSKAYYLLGCGRWVYQDDAKRDTTIKKLNDTPLTIGDVTVTDRATALTFGTKWNIPYNLLIAPQSYAAPGASTPDYGITAQTTEYVDLTFYYIQSAPAAPDMSDSPLFSSAKWQSVNGNQRTLRLTLRHKGEFYGYSAVWKEHQLCFSFRHPAGITDNGSKSPLKGIRIVIDPGHGGSSSGTYGTIKGLYEREMTLRYSLELRNKLQALGATVDMTRTTDILPDNPTMATRTAHARNNNTDLLLSIHMNGAAATSASGCTLHYFNEYSRDIAGRLTKSMRAVEKEYGIGNRQVVTIWSPFFLARVHDCPAVLVECGFMTNAKNMDALNDSTYQSKLVNAMADAVMQYFAALPHYQVKDPADTTTAAEPTATEPTAATEPTTPAEPTKPSEPDEPSTPPDISVIAA